MARLFEHQGLGYVLRVPELATEIAVRRLSRARGELHGEVRVSCGLAGTRSSDGHLHQARMNMSSTQSRATLSKALAYRATLPDVDWTDLLEDFCRRVLEAEEVGEPVLMVGARPRPVSRPYRLDPILPLGDPAILYGEGGTGKSTLAAAIAVSVETGVAVIPGWVPRRAPVLYLDWESGPDAINERISLVAAGANLPEPAQIRYRAMTRPLPDQAEDVATIVAEHGIGLVIVDSVGLASGASGDAGDAADTAWRLFAAFRVLGSTVLAIDHISKASADEPGKPSRPYGSVYKGYLARVTYELRRNDGEEGATLGLYNTKANDRAKLPPIALAVRHEEHAIEYIRLDELPEELTRPLHLADRIVPALAFQSMTAKEIAELVGSSYGVVSQTLRRDRRFMKMPSSDRWEVIGKEASRAG